VEDGGVEVVDVDTVGFLVDDVVAEVIGLAVAEAAFDSGSGKVDGETAG